MNTITKYQSDVVLLVPGNTFSSKFIVSWSKTLDYLNKNKISYLYKFYYSPIISAVRNCLLGLSFDEQDLKSVTVPLQVFDGLAKTKTVIFIDSDMVWEPQAIQQLIDSPYDATVAPYILSDRITSSVRIKDSFLSIEEIKEYTKPTPIHSAGMGFTACKFEILKQISFPWFQTAEYKTSEEGVSKGGTMGEDIVFFMNLHNAGFVPYMDPSIKVGHEKSTVLTL